MEFKSLQKISRLYHVNPQFRASLQNNPAKALTLWHIEDEQGAQALANNNTWLFCSPDALCAAMLQGEPLNWDGPIPLPNVAQ
jgi:hypothetical protein